uniref:Uncharacterized protein n=1 Tax=Anguilla anguilla TaxID=7936 RepID=A0A0E9UTT4_ANGAN
MQKSRGIPKGSQSFSCNHTVYTVE